MIVRPTLLDRDVAPLDPAKLAQSVDECINPLTVRVAPTRAKIPDGRQLACLLRPCRERPRHRRAAEKRDELAALNHSMTSSARASSVDGKSRPSGLAVFKLTTGSYLGGACTGRSAGFPPLRMRSTEPAASRKGAIESGPEEIRPPTGT